MAPIAGRVTGARPGQRIVVYARSGVWWVQPLANQPFTTIESDSTWRTSTHLGTEYAALLVEHELEPPATIEKLPATGGPVRTVATVRGSGSLQTKAPKTLHFSGYDWDIRQFPSNPGGDNTYLADNAWTDGDGFLHLRIARRSDEWISSDAAKS